MKKIAVVFVLLLLCAFSASAQQAFPVHLQRTIALPGVTGKFDHFAIDLAADRLFVAASGNHTVEVIDLKTDKVVQSIPGIEKPHGLAWVAATGSLYVADGVPGELRAYKGWPLALAGKIALSEDTDDMVYDRTAHLLFVGHGGSDAAHPAKVAVVNVNHFTLVDDIAAATHPEALEIDPKSQRIFANIADSNEVEVIDAAGKTITAQWKLTKAADNVSMAFDGEHQLLYVGCRKPGMLIALDAATGKEIASVPAAGKTDDLFYDAARGRVYLIGGAGELDTFQVTKEKTLRALGVVHTPAGAKTGLFVPSQNLLYLGVPGIGSDSAAIRVYSTSAIRRKQ